MAVSPFSSTNKKEEGSHLKQEVITAMSVSPLTRKIPTPTSPSVETKEEEEFKVNKEQKVTSPFSPLAKEIASPPSPSIQLGNNGDLNGPRIKLPSQFPLNQGSGLQGNSALSGALSPTYHAKATRAASISVVPHANIDIFNNGVSTSLGTSPSTRYQRPNPLSASVGGWSNQRDIWSNDYSPAELSRSPSFAKDPESPYSRSYLASLQDPFLSPRRSSYNPSDTLGAGLGRTRTATGTEFTPRIRNPLAALKDESSLSERQLSSSMSPAFGAGIDRSPMYRDYVGSPQLSSSFNQEFDDMPFALNPNDYYRVGMARRMSLTPSFGPFHPYDDLNTSMEGLTLEEYANLVNRRHSVAASAFPNRKPSQLEPLEPARLDTLEEDQDDQAEQFALDLDTNEPTKARDPNQETFLVVEFKGNRNDLFYPAPECSSSISAGDKVIVEGDRGKDLGTVIRADITIEEYKAQFSQITAGPDGSQAVKDIEPKKIFRAALPHEIASLTTKSQDEDKALQLVRAKAIQREIYMQIVDAEYQWDRRKLTFYFIADRRIDFRDLVRELFKIYKTRIWMCAVTR